MINMVNLIICYSKTHKITPNDSLHPPTYISHQPMLSCIMKLMSLKFEIMNIMIEYDSGWLSIRCITSII